MDANPAQDPARVTAPPPAPMRDLCLISANIENDGGSGDAGRERWKAAHELFAGHQPDVVLRQEISTQARCDDGAQMLGMHGWMTSGPDVRHHTGIYLHPDTFAVHEVFGLRRRWRIPATVARVSLRGAPGRELHLVSWHTAYDSIAARRLEADDLTGLINKASDRTGRPAIGLIGGGDCNSYPVSTGRELADPIDWNTVTDTVHRWHRAEPTDDGPWVPDTYLDQMMRATGMNDAADYAARHLGQALALAPTAGHAPTARGQGGDCRIDRVYVDPHLAAAITSVEVLDLTGLSDHHAIKVTLDRAVLTTALSA